MDEHRRKAKWRAAVAGRVQTRISPFYHAMGRLQVVVTLLVAAAVENALSDEYLLRSAYPTWLPARAQCKPGDRLILTQYMERDMLDEGRERARVEGYPFCDDIPSYAGYFIVNKEFNSNLFFWFFPAEENYRIKPVILWLQGGPGTSSLLGLFTEIGPFTLAEDNITLVPNPHSWHRNHSLIFIDNPVGTGFSFTDYDAGYATNMTQVGDELYKALVQFFEVFPELRRLPFFIAGESFAGKYIPALAHTIHKRNPKADVQINLKGIAVGNGFTDPVHFLDMSEYVFQLGLVDGRIRDAMRLTAQRAAEAIKCGNLTLAFVDWVLTLALFGINARYSQLYNFMETHERPVGGSYSDFVQRCDVRRALHVGDTEYTSLGHVYVKMIPDFMSTVKPQLEVLLENYQVMYYSGQLDLAVAYPMSVRMFDTLNFSSSDDYHLAPRRPWYVGEDLAGYIKTAGKFSEVLVRNAGHMVPTDQPEWAYDLISRFVSGRLP
ncbi:venom serine carboxypeptidase-like [Anabrus simplex]|uniref:venom serine carboxypeptidase-like n=1 Tax=Anabrus simplex TaxID=316456 RepID=UPI0035A37732